MAIDIITVRQGGILRPFSMDDEDSLRSMAENRPLRNHITGAAKARSYRHLCCFWSSCSFIASHDFNNSMNTKDKVSYMTRIVCGFVDGFLTMKDGSIQWMPKSLSYDNCDHPESVQFINQALERHAGLLCVSTDEYINMLNTQGFTKYVF